MTISKHSEIAERKSNLFYIFSSSLVWYSFHCPCYNLLTFSFSGIFKCSESLWNSFCSAVDRGPHSTPHTSRVCFFCRECIVSSPCLPSFYSKCPPCCWWGQENDPLWGAMVDQSVARPAALHIAPPGKPEVSLAIWDKANVKNDTRYWRTVLQ